MWPFEHRRLEQLAAIGDAPLAQVRIRARVANGNAVVSPVTGLRGATFQWTVFSREEHAREQSSAGSWYRQVGSGQFGEDLLLTVPGGSILLPFPGYELVFAKPDDTGELLQRPLPPGWLTGPRVHGTAYYREIFLLSGDAVEVTCTVRPRVGGGGGAYRGGPTGDFIAVYDHEPARVDDLSTPKM